MFYEERPNMPKHDRFRTAVRAVWERSHATYLAWPEEQRALTQPAANALLDWLADAENEGELITRYWEIGDPPGVVLRQHLPAGFDPEEALTLEEACFWRRLMELEADTTGA